MQKLPSFIQYTPGYWSSLINTLTADCTKVIILFLEKLIFAICLQIQRSSNNFNRTALIHAWEVLSDHDYQIYAFKHSHYNYILSLLGWGGLLSFFRVSWIDVCVKMNYSISLYLKERFKTSFIYIFIQFNDYAVVHIMVLMVL